MLTKRKLAIISIAETRIIECTFSVDEKDETVLKTLHTISVVLALVILWISHVRRTVALAQIDRIITMNRLIHSRIVPKMLHDVDFAPMRPTQVMINLWQHPNGRPKTLCNIELRPHFNPSEAKGFLVFAPHASREESGIVVGQKVIHHTTQHEVAFVESIQRVMGRHVDGPIRLASSNLRPDLLVQTP